MMNQGFAGHYRPELLPGGSTSRPDVDTAGPNARGGVRARTIQSRVHMLQERAGADPMLRAFFDSDVPYMLAVIRAADRWANATNAETSRRASEELHAAVRRP